MSKPEVVETNHKKTNAANLVFTPSSTSAFSTPQRSATASPSARDNIAGCTVEMDTARDEKTGQTEDVNVNPPTAEPSSAITDRSLNDAKAAKPSKKNKKSKAACSKHKLGKRSVKGKKATTSDSESDDDSSGESVDSTSDETSDETSSSSDEEPRRKKSNKKARKLRKAKIQVKKRSKKAKKYQSSSDDSESDTSDASSGSEPESDTRSRRRRKGNRKVEESETDSEPDDEIDDEETSKEELLHLLVKQNVQRQLAQLSLPPLRTPAFAPRQLSPLDNGIPPPDSSRKKKKNSKGKKSKKSGKRASTLEFKRVDELWDNTIHNFKLTESAEDQADEFDTYVFTVRRKFDWENKYRNTVVDIKSKLLREALQEVMKDVKGVSLVEEQPCVDPNMLFLYLEELRTYAKKSLKAKAKKERKKKTKRKINTMIAHCKVMVRYLDEDYDETKKTLYPMLDAGNITFDLLWALFKPNTIAYTTTYGSVEHPRCFKVDYATKECSFIRGEWYTIEGRYLEYDGKNYGLGDFEINVESFKGPRKITSLATYPLRYHKDAEGLQKQLIERGKKFVTMTGMNYKFHKGLAFEKRKKTVAKHNINGRVMIDPAIFRRINPNYPISLIKPKDQDALYDVDSCCGCSDDESDEDERPEGAENPAAGEQEEREKMKLKIIYDEEKKQHHVVQVPVDEDGQEIQVEKLDKLTEDAEGAEKEQEFTEEELLIASPVVLGFAFSEKRWMEFSLSDLRDIEWNDQAFSSLVLPQTQKSIVKALVSSHKFHAAQTIDDVVQGKGRGLVFVLHGPPGVGKTLTAEGIADYLKCPLYAVSAGELGTESWRLEQELQKIMDIAHSWGAVLLLDEADVFLEKRQVHDIHRNALVSIFLRLLEYFQGILFLTTNRVETFDDAFQSRTHVGLRYEELGVQAKREIWRMFLERVRDMDGTAMVEFKASDYDTLARNNLNGRQIKNAVRTAQALAVNEGEKLSMTHIKSVLEVAESFERDLKGGTGYMDAMRSYT